LEGEGHSRNRDDGKAGVEGLREVHHVLEFRGFRSARCTLDRDEAKSQNRGRGGDAAPDRKALSLRREVHDSVLSLPEIQQGASCTKATKVPREEREKIFRRTLLPSRSRRGARRGCGPRPGW